MIFESVKHVLIWNQKWSSRQDVSCKKGALRNFTKFTAKDLCLRPATLLKKRLWHRCFPVNFVKFLRTPVFIEHLSWLFFSCLVKKVLKVGLSLSKKICVTCFIESPLKVIKKAFYFILNAPFFLKIFKFLSWLLGHVGKTTWLERYV